MKIIFQFQNEQEIALFSKSIYKIMLWYAFVFIIA